MRESKKNLPAILICALVAVVVVASLWPHRGEVQVQVARVERRNLVSIVRATGELFPTSYTNVLGQGYGRVTDILVREGEFVRPGNVLLRVDDVQAAATVRAHQAALASAHAGLLSAQAAVKSAQASVARSQAALLTARFNWQQGQKLYQAQVISRQNFESYRTANLAAEAAVGAAAAQLVSARGQQARAAAVVEQDAASLAHLQDLLDKTVYRAPIAGTVTNIAARVGENVIPGVPSSDGAYLMTISDFSNLYAQVAIDENRIGSLRVGQPATLQIDAFPGVTFPGRVLSVGAQAIITATGQASSQEVGGSSALQAINYQVDLSLDHPPHAVRPGMTVNAVIETATRNNAVAVPFQALVLRPKSEAGRASLPPVDDAAPVELAASSNPSFSPPAGVTGVFLVRSGHAIFTPVDIGVLGEDDVEARKGVQPGDLIVVGGFVALQELHSGMPVQIVKGD